MITLNSKDAEGRAILLTGYWPPTNEMLRPFSQNPDQNPSDWEGLNWEGAGYDVYAYFPEFANSDDAVGTGDFKVDYEDTKADFDRVTQQLKPVAIISFGRGQGPWEIEVNFPDYYKISDGKTYHGTLPGKVIAKQVNQNTPVRAWVDAKGDAGNFLCGYIGHLGARYRTSHPEVQATGFIHVSGDLSLLNARLALEETLRALIESLKRQ